MQKEQHEIQTPGDGRGCGLSVGVTGVETEWGEVQRIPIREQGLCFLRAYDRTDGSDPNLRPGQSLTHATEEKTNWRSPSQGPRSRVCNRALPTETAWTSLLEMTEGRAQSLTFHLLSHSRFLPFPRVSLSSAGSVRMGEIMGKSRYS